jgi:hypothetical protein
MVKNFAGFPGRRAKIKEFQSMWGVKMLNVVRQFEKK